MILRSFISPTDDETYERKFNGLAPVKMAGRPKGAWSEKRFREALQAAVTEEGAGGQKRLRNIAEQLVKAAEGGDIQAIREIADRLDGKPAQAITGEDGGPIEMTVSWQAASA